MLEPLALEMKWGSAIPIYYQHIHRLIVNRQSRRLISIPMDQEGIPRKYIFLCLYDNHIPKEIISDFLEEMQSYKLLELVNKQNIKVKKLA